MNIYRSANRNTLIMLLIVFLSALMGIIVVFIRTNKNLSSVIETVDFQSLAVSCSDDIPYHNLTEAMNDPASVCRLSLAGQELDAIPPETVNLSNLEELDLHGNKLSSLPPEIQNLKKLTRLDLGDNKFTSIPVEISALSNLEILEIGFNNIEIIPSWIGNLKNLRELAVNKNSI